MQAIDLCIQFVKESAEVALESPGFYIFNFLQTDIWFYHTIIQAFSKCGSRALVTGASRDVCWPTVTVCLTDLSPAGPLLLYLSLGTMFHMANL